MLSENANEKEDFLDSIRLDYTENVEQLTLDGFYKDKSEVTIPVSIFNNERLSALEAITKYLKEQLKLSYSEISGLLNRSTKTVWGAYSKAIKKMPEEFRNARGLDIPCSLLKERKLSVLETITAYLKDSHNMRYSQIACRLNRNDRTIWTVYQRARKKMRKNGFSS